ncbi:hypothetical protein [Actinacidiphila sp. ITFR-21]|uniref:hypothetical protein n=1 Tax=Actinacidiphila sp. ITFR-21 TaxID=3075199 RepID=UPI00288956F6|nr:hypothetical protein [Streptomyces sp. ITFR-21]WNI20195.1 hypothetical protein RLT57_32160 [Streptomyces sp. ITFR-21]
MKFIGLSRTDLVGLHRESTSSESAEAITGELDVVHFPRDAAHWPQDVAEDGQRG